MHNVKPLIAIVGALIVFRLLSQLKKEGVVKNDQSKLYGMRQSNPARIG